MEIKRDKVALITGASNGIGKATAIKFAEQGYNLILIARNETALREVAEYAVLTYGIEVAIIISDVRDYKNLRAEINGLPVEFQKIDVLVNNAGLALGLDKVYENTIADIDSVIDTNIKGILYMTEIVVPKMLEFGMNGTIINIGSIAGNSAYAGGAVYCATKAAVKTISDGLRIDLVDKAIRVTTILPGMVETDFSLVRFKGDKTRAENVYKGITALTPEDIADTILYVATLPHNVQINDITMTPIHQADGRCVHKI